MPVPERARLTEYARKGLDLAGRYVGRAPEQRQGRRLGRAVKDRLQAERGRTEAADRPRVLFLTPRDWAFHVQFEATLARLEGIFACPESATVVAGLEQALAEGIVARHERVVLMVTGSGLKSIPVLPGAPRKTITAHQHID